MTPFRRRDTQVMFVVSYEDGHSAYLRIAPQSVSFGNAIVADIARDRQTAGDLPAGRIIV